MEKKEEAAKNWCFDGSLPSDGIGGERAERLGKLFRSAWTRPVAASTGPAYQGYRRIG